MKIISLVTMGLFITVPVFAATIHFKDGGSIEGTIIEQTPQAVRIETNGAVMTYFADEIKDINGQPIGVKPTNVSAPARITTKTGDGQVDMVHQLTSTSSTPAASPIAPEKKELILRFMEAFGTKDSLEKNLAMMVERINQEKPELAQKIRDRIKFDELIAELLPAYDRNFTAEELKAFISFYGSPEGKKLIGTMPVLMRETVEASTRYLQRKFPELED